MGFRRLKVPLLVLAPGLAVLEPVEDVGIAHLTVFLQLGSDLPYLVAGRVHHTRIEDGFEDPDLLRLRVPSGLRLRAALFATLHCKEDIACYLTLSSSLCILSSLFGYYYKTTTDKLFIRDFKHIKYQFFFFFGKYKISVVFSLIC